MKVTVAYGAPGVEAIEHVEVPTGSTVGDALARTAFTASLAMPVAVSYAIHGQRARLDTTLADGDRVEIVRPLIADPKAVRRARAADHPLPPTRKVKRRKAALT
jgi:putative ubiquitin-RnfH superfamily antitoxin RatB of RatAB toxin-antitoxin module